MVLESFINPSDARKSSWSLFFLGLIYSSVGILLALIVFPEQASTYSIFLATLAAAPLFVSLLKDEEALNIQLIEEKRNIFGNNLNIVSAFFFLFLGFTVSFSLWFSFLPEWALNDVFSEQINNISSIRSIITGNFLENTFFWTILQNNLRVLFFCLLFSFLYGAGAVLILCWNASILGSAVGIFIREKIAEITGADYLSSITVYLSNLPYGLGQYMFHGSFEIVAYFLASIAGGIVSASIVRKRYKSSNFLKLIRNIVILVTAAILFLIIAAFIEVTF